MSNVFLKNKDVDYNRLENKIDQLSELVQKTLSAFIESQGLSEDEDFMNQINPPVRIPTPPPGNYTAADYITKSDESVVLSKRWLNVMTKLQNHRMSLPEEKQGDDKWKTFYSGMLQSHEKYGSLTKGQFPWVSKSLQKEAFIVDPMLGEPGTSFGDNL